MATMGKFGGQATSRIGKSRQIVISHGHTSLLDRREAVTPCAGLLSINIWINPQRTENLWVHQAIAYNDPRDVYEPLRRFPRIR